ncbi:hypothetical protein [Nostoc sp.]|uniref:hypothetical protein n=1 Tax=Nostoc sp. TaxID=1180 RepID=UPI002FFA7FA7
MQKVAYSLRLYFLEAGCTANLISYEYSQTTLMILKGVNYCSGILAIFKNRQPMTCKIKLFEQRLSEEDKERGRQRETCLLVLFDD